MPCRIFLLTHSQRIDAILPLFQLSRDSLPYKNRVHLEVWTICKICWNKGPGHEGKKTYLFNMRNDVFWLDTQKI